MSLTLQYSLKFLCIYDMLQSNKKTEYDERTVGAPASTSSEIGDRDDSDEDGEIDIQVTCVICK